MINLTIVYKCKVRFYVCTGNVLIKTSPDMRYFYQIGGKGALL